MEKTAILIDGGFFHRRANDLWGSTATPQKRAQELMRHCCKHLFSTALYSAERVQTHALYRIFYYDCPPLDKVVYHPFLKKNIDLKKSALYSWMTEFHNEMRKKRQVALRLGRLSDIGVEFILHPEKVKKLYSCKIKVENIKEHDFILSTRQKGVDMKIGVDIASIAYKQQVGQIVLIAGDSDFVPAAKIARREGIDFILDPLYANINADLHEHIDGLRSFHHQPSRKYKVVDSKIPFDK